MGLITKELIAKIMISKSVIIVVFATARVKRNLPLKYFTAAITVRIIVVIIIAIIDITSQLVIIVVVFLNLHLIMQLHIIAVTKLTAILMDSIV